MEADRLSLEEIPLEKINRSIEQVPVEKIVLMNWGIRQEWGDIDKGLVESIENHGLIQPILVRPFGKEGNFQLVLGWRRLRAFKKLGRKTIRALIQDLDEKTAFEIALVENLQRHDLSVLDEGRAFLDYVHTNGWGSETELAKKIGKNRSYVAQRIQVGRAFGWVGTWSDREKCSPVNKLGLRHLLELCRVKDRDNRKKLAELAGEYGWTVKQTKAHVEGAVMEAAARGDESVAIEMEKWEQKRDEEKELQHIHEYRRAIKTLSKCPKCGKTGTLRFTCCHLNPREACEIFDAKRQKELEAK